MIAARRLSVSDGKLLAASVQAVRSPAPESEIDVLRWLAGEYEVGFDLL